MKEIPNLDELLNSFIDEELPPRQRTEVQRLIAHDEKIAQRLRQLQKCKMLLSSLPVAEAPPQILENVKVSLARRSLLGEEPSAFDERVGARHLLGRKVFAAAAMLGLVGILTAVVYTIVAPQPVTQGPVVERRDLPPKVDVLEPAPRLIAAPFSGRLELRTNYLPAVVSIINKAIEENIPSDEWIASDRSYVREPHALICSTESFNLLLAKLDNIWDKLDSAILLIDTEVFGEQVVVDAVTAEQIAGIVNQEDPQRRIKVAKDFAAFNHITERMPGREILTAIDDTTVRFITPPKPALTQDEKTFKKLATGTKADKNIRLTITVMTGN
jgi:hypothetical protein